MQDVKPNGEATPFDTGYQMGSFRQLTKSQSWYLNRKLILLAHPYTQASRAALPAGSVVPVDIAVGPVLARIANGDRLRVAITTNINSRALRNPTRARQPDWPDHRRAAHRDRGVGINLPMIPSAQLPTSRTSWRGCRGAC